MRKVAALIFAMVMVAGAASVFAVDDTVRVGKVKMKLPFQTIADTLHVKGVVKEKNKIKPIEMKKVCVFQDMSNGIKKWQCPMKAKAASANPTK